MKPERDDPIFDAAIEEVVTGRGAPDLQKPIMDKYEARNLAEPVHGAATPGAALSTGAVVPPPVGAYEPPVQRSRSGRSANNPYTKTTIRWGNLAIAVTLLLACGVIGVLALRSSGDPDEQPPIVHHDDPPDGPPKKQPDNSVAHQQGHGTGGGLNKPPDFSNPAVVASGTPMQLQPLSVAKRLPLTQVVHVVGDNLSTGWQQADITPSPVADDAKWCRRTYLRIVGRIPTVKELQTFTSDRRQNKREVLVDQLLEDDAFPRHWAEQWTNTLIGRRGGMDGQKLVNREGMQQYLLVAFGENRPWDQIVKELVSATGANTPGTPGFNGATNFILSGLESKATVATSKTSRIFLGVQMQCMQCHNHLKTGEGQHNFWQLNAFFQQAASQRDDKGIVRLVNRDAPNNPDDPENSGVFYERPDSTLAIAYPVFIDGTEMPKSGRILESNRRRYLAEYISTSPNFARAMVNRYWAHFTGYGFTNPIDDMGPHRPVSHPELLDHLAAQFVAHGYDHRALVRWIALAEGFRRDAQLTKGNAKDDPSIGNAPLFSRYYTRQLGPEEIFQSLDVLSGSSSAGDASKLARRSWLDDFARKLHTDDQTEENSFDGTISQAVKIINSPIMEAATSNQPGTMLHRVINSDLSNEDKVKHLFLAALAREPAPSELQKSIKLLTGDQAKQGVALTDIWWALLNSNEFILDH